LPKTASGFDIDNRKVTELEHGRSYIYRIPESNIQLAREQGFRATSDFSQLPDLDAIIICVPTPLTEHREPDLTYIESTARTIAPWLQPGQLVVLESTTYPGHDRGVADPDPGSRKRSVSQGSAG
jgi:UDP-N-acetyl-D-glucosamine dehydrogenase